MFPSRETTRALGAFTPKSEFRGRSPLDTYHHVLPRQLLVFILLSLCSVATSRPEPISACDRLMPARLKIHRMLSKSGDKRDTLVSF